MTNTQRVIGLPAAIFTLVGFVVGASIYTVPAELASSSGAGVLLSFAIAAVLAVVGCVPTIQLACAFPVAGAGYVAVRELLSPAAGVVAALAVLTASIVAVALLAHGFAAYAVALWPMFDGHALTLAVSLVAVLTVMNLAGTRTAVAAQVVMSLAFILVLLVFGILGVQGDGLRQHAAVSVNTLGAIVLGIVPAYFSFLGFTLIGELAGDMRTPERTLPLTLGIGFALILIIYLLVTFALLAGSSQQQLAQAVAPVMTVASGIAGERFAQLVALSALLAAATSVNGVLMMVSRDVLLLSRDDVLPRKLGATSGEQDTPRPAIALIGLLSFACIAVDSSIQAYAITTVIGFVVFQTLSAVAAYWLPRRAPQTYQQASYRFSEKTLRWNGGALVGVSLVMLVLGVLSAPMEVASYVAVMAILLVLLTPRVGRNASPVRIDESPRRKAGFTQ
ncbi:APC family permease [Parahaliea mediterranea]|uniref:APC family permease n=1 Tax=Parahaliea mediterranea TaxID=651086 RepID=UPI00130096CF|nr:APC family permease [Parahaliea mediterranea]